MPLQQRVIEPVNVSRSTLPLPPGDIKPLIKKIAAETGQGLAANAAAAANAEELLTGVFDEASNLLTRTVNLQQRMEILSTKAENLNQVVDAPLTLRDATKHQEYFSSDMSYDQQILSKLKMPSSIVELYETCEKPPPLNMLDPYRDDGKDGLKFYTDPTYFFELWKKEIHQQVNQLQKQQQQLRQQQQQQPQSQQLPQRPSSLHAPQQQAQVLPNQSQHHQQQQHKQSQQQSQHHVQRQQHPTQQQQHQIHQQQLLLLQQQQSTQSQQQLSYQQSVGTVDPSMQQQFQQSLYISNGPQTNQANQSQMTATPPPPPPALSPLPAPSFPPPPPPPPAPPSPTPPVAQQLPVLTAPTAAQLQQRQQQLKKTVPVQRDPRSDLLAAIKQGITLRRVEDSKRRVEAEKQQSMGNDVASILARRVAMQVSDSDDNDDDDEENEWDDSNNG